jgi:hypothetical protein
LSDAPPLEPPRQFVYDVQSGVTWVLAKNYNYDPPGTVRYSVIQPPKKAPPDKERRVPEQPGSSYKV